MSAALEHEVKLLAPPEFSLPAVDGALPGLTAGAPARFELDARYYDTTDLALARSGVTLRYRAGESGPPWTVKLPDDAGPASLTRAEIRFDGSPDRVPTGARDLVRAYTRSRRLRTVAHLHTRRTSVPLLDADGTRAGEVVDDLVATYTGTHRTGHFHEVEVELDGPRRVGRLQRAAEEWLASAGCETGTPLPTLVRALGPRAAAPPDVVVIPVVSTASVLELIRYVLALSLQRLIRHDPGVRLGDDPEDVHQFRVAARTLRSNLKTFAPALAPDRARQLRTELGWLGGVAGELRDREVFALRLRGLTSELDADDDAGVTSLFHLLAEQHELARSATLAAIRSRRYDALLADLVTTADAPPLINDALANTPASALVRQAVRRQVRRLDKVMTGIEDHPSDAALHAVRIQAKRARYAIEAGRPVIGRPAKDHAAVLARLQDILGDYHDSTVAVQWLRDAAAADPARGLTAGQLLAAERSEQARLRSTMRGPLRDARAKKLREWL